MMNEMGIDPLTIPDDATAKQILRRLDDATHGKIRSVREDPRVGQDFEEE
jgi:hypothetical protein